MNQVALKFENMKHLSDGKVSALLAKHLQRASQDCIDRPGDTHARKVLLEFCFTPHVDQEGNCDKVTCEVEARTKVPVYRSTKIEMKPTAAGFLFNPDFDEIDQQKMFEEEST